MSRNTPKDDREHLSSPTCRAAPTRGNTQAPAALSGLPIAAEEPPLLAPRPSPRLLSSAAALTSTALTGAAARSAVTAPSSAASASIPPGPGSEGRGVATK